MANSNRREFLEAAAISAIGAPALAAQTADAKKMIGIQIGAVSFVDEGVEPVLDILQSKGRVNALFIAAFTYGRGIAGRQVPKQPLAGSWKAGVRHSHIPRRKLRGGSSSVLHKHAA